MPLPMFLSIHLCSFSYYAQEQKTCFPASGSEEMHFQWIGQKIQFINCAYSFHTTQSLIQWKAIEGLPQESGVLDGCTVRQNWYFKYGDFESPQETALTLEHFSYYSGSSCLKWSYCRLNVQPKVHFTQTSTQNLTRGSYLNHNPDLEILLWVRGGCMFLSFHPISWTTTRFAISGSFITVLMFKTLQYFTT